MLEINQKVKVLDKDNKIVGEGIIKKVREAGNGSYEVKFDKKTLWFFRSSENENVYHNWYSKTHFMVEEK